MTPQENSSAILSEWLFIQHINLLREQRVMWGEGWDEGVPLQVDTQSYQNSEAQLQQQQNLRGGARQLINKHTELSRF